MKLQTFLNEDTDIDFDTVLKECSEIVDIYKQIKSFLYRGSKHNFAQDITKITPRTDRRPLDSSVEVSRKLDDEFYKRFKWRPRSEGVFCTSTLSNAHTYGDSYIFFPKNGFKFVWSRKFEDFYSNIYDAYYSEYYTTVDINKFFTLEDKYMDFEKIVSEYTNRDIKDAIEIGHEMMFKCDYYYMADYTETNYLKLLNSLD